MEGHLSSGWSRRPPPPVHGDPWIPICLRSLGTAKAQENLAKGRTTWVRVQFRALISQATTHAPLPVRDRWEVPSPSAGPFGCPGPTSQQRRPTTCPSSRRARSGERTQPLTGWFTQCCFDWQILDYKVKVRVVWNISKQNRQTQRPTLTGSI